MSKIVIVLNSSWNVWNFRLPLLLALEQDGHQVEVIAPKDAYTARIPFPCHHVDIESKSTNPFVDIRLPFRFWQIFRMIKPDVALLYTVKPNVYANFAASIAGVRTISNVAGLGTVFNGTGFLVKLVKLLYRVSLRGADKVFFQNKEDLAQFVAEHIVNSSITGCLPGSGVDLERFNPARFIRANGADKFIFLLPARMLWEKGVGEYVEAARRLIAEAYLVEFRLVGFLDVDNPDAITLQEMNELTDKPEIVYLGVSDSIEEEIAKVDCVVLPSKYREGTPRVLLEAAAMAVPIITTDAPGCRDVIKNEVTGYLCRTGDSGDLYKKMKKMLELDMQSRTDMGIRGREKVALEYDQKLVIDKYRTAINEILSP